MKIKQQAFIIFILASLFYFYQIILQVSPDVLSPYLIAKFSVSEYRAGLLTSAFFFAYMLMQIPVGILIDKWGTRRTISFASVLCALGALLFSIAPYFFVASISRLVMGVGAAFSYIAGLKLISEWFPKKSFSFMMGLLSTIGMFGGILGEAPLARLVEQIGWQESMFFLSLVGLVISGLIFLFIKNAPLSINAPIQQELSDSSKYRKAIFHNKQLWFASFYVAITSIPPIILTSLYGVPFLRDKYNISELNAAQMISFIFIGFMIGGPAWGWFSDFIKRRLPLLYITAITTPLILFLIVYCRVSIDTVNLLLFSLGFFSYGSIGAFSIVQETNRPQCLGTALGVLNMFDGLGVALMLPIFGRLLNVYGKHVPHKATYVYGLVDYQHAFAIVIAMMIIPIILLKFIKETHAIHLFPEATTKEIN
jgi:MFS family permease